MSILITNLFKSQYIKKTCIVFGLIAIVFIMVWVRSFYGSMKAYHEGETYLKEHQYIKAITFFDRSIHWYTPFNPYIRKSAERLWEIGNHAEGQGDIKLALIAFRTIRRGFHAASSFYSPGKRWIEKCELKINELVMIEEEKEGGREDFKSSKEITPGGQNRVSPSIFWTIILEIGFLGWVGSVIGFIIFILGRKGESKYLTFSSLTWIGLIFVFFALWIVGMMKA